MIKLSASTNQKYKKKLSVSQLPRFEEEQKRLLYALPINKVGSRE